MDANRLTSNEELMARGYLPQAGEAEQRAMLAVANALARPAPAMRRGYAGPMPNRPVVNGRAVVTAEELADFRRQYGPQMTLRDLLNADRAGVPSAGVPSAADMRARGPQGANVLAAGDPYADPSRMLEGVAAAQRGRTPQQDAITPIAPELGLILGGKLAAMFAARAAASSAASAAPEVPVLTDALPRIMRPAGRAWTLPPSMIQPGGTPVTPGMVVR